MKRTVQLSMVAILVTVGGYVAGSPIAVAQEPSRAEVAAARRLFRQGMRAGEQENWEEAREAFARAYEIVPRPRVLLNLASAQMQTGQLLEATESYQRFLAQVTSGPDTEYREGVEEELRGLEERTPRIRIEVTALRSADQVHVDDVSVSRAVLQVDLPLNPGAHSVAVVRDGGEIAREELSLEEGQERAVNLDATGMLPSPTLPAEEEEDDLLAPEEDGESGGILASPWFWTGVGAAVVVGVVIAIVIAVSGGDPERRNGNFGDGRLLIE